MTEIRSGSTLATIGGALERALTATAAFVSARLHARDEDRLWRSLAVVLGLLPGCVFMAMIVTRPDIIQDDARQFLSWMGRWDDPALLRGDLIADYWSSVSPWAYHGLFYAAWQLGIEPLLFVKILPVLLYPVTALFSYRFLRTIGADPLIAFVGTACAISMLVGNEGIVSGTPRAFWPLLLLALLGYLARSKPIQVAVAQLLLAGMYPQIALVTATAIGMTLVKPSARSRLDLCRDRIIMVLGAALATVAGLLPFLLSTSTYGPAFSLDEARAIPTFGPGGRGAIFLEDGSVDRICGLRLGFLSLDCDGWWHQLTLIAGLVIGPVVLLARSLPGKEVRSLASPLPLLLLASTVIWFLISSALLFRLHLPSRFSAAASLIAILTAVPLTAGWIRNLLPLAWLSRSPLGQVLLIGGAALALYVLAIGAIRVPGTVAVPRSPDLIAAIRALPKEDVVAGFIPDLDYSPLLTGRATLFNRELAVAYQKGYFLPIMSRMEAMRDVILTRDPAVLAARLTANHVDWLLVWTGTLAEGRVLFPFRGFFGKELAPLEDAARQQGPSVLEQRAKACTAGEYDEVLVLNAHCLAR